MENQTEEVYVAVGNDLQDGLKTLEWTLKKWSFQPISIVILHVTYNASKDFVYTPFGKLPATSVSDEKLEVLKKYERETIDKLLSKYISFCGKVKAELLQLEKCDEPIQKVVLDLISKHRITKLVMGFTFMKSTSWKIKSAISGSFYIQKNKPEFCELFIICGGKLVFLRGESNKGIMEDEQGVLVAKLREKPSFKGWLGKMFIESQANSLEIRDPSRCLSASTSMGSSSSQNQWGSVEEIESYFQQLLSLNLEEEEEEEIKCEQENENSQTSPAEEPAMPEPADPEVSGLEKIEVVKAKIREAQKIKQLKRKEAKANLERHAKAEWAISLCNRRAEQLEALIKEEVNNQVELKKEIEAEKEILFELISETEESKKKLSSLTELQSELSNKLHLSTLGKKHAETELEKAVSKRANMLREIEELRQQRDVLHRRIEFCKEKDAIRKVAKLTELSCGFKEYTAEEIRLATNGFSERLRLKPGGEWSTVYKGRINQSTIAIKMLNSIRGLSHEDFQAKVTLLSHIRHPHLVAMVGFCTELKSIVFEYMHNGSLRDIFLRDILYSSHRRYSKRIRTLLWYDRIRIATEVCSGLSFLHLAKPRPIVHGHLTLSNILLDRKLVAKISGFGLMRNYDEQSVRLDVRAFGVLLMHLLTGRNWAGLVEAMNMDKAALVRDLDEMAGEWPLDLAERLAELALRCLSGTQGPNRELRMDTVMHELNELRKNANDMLGKEGCEVVTERDDHGEDPDGVPNFFLCPIFQEVMTNPHVAADGFSYELEAIEEWLRMGRDTSPMTNLRLSHTFLTPNHGLRSLIQDWHNKRSIPPGP